MVGTGFSGSDITHHVLKAMSSLWSEKLCMQLDFTFLFACEIDPRKRAFLREQFPTLATIFCDMDHLSLVAAHNDVTGQMAPVPFVHLFIGGFVCVDRSKLNVRRQQHKNCVQDGTGKTGSSFAMLYRYLDKCRPWAFILENVTDLGAKSDDKDQSDVEFIISTCREIGYEVKALTISAQEYGSVALRTRHFYVGYQCVGEFGHTVGTGSSVYDTVQRVKIPPRPVMDFLPNLQDLQVTDRITKRSRIDPAFKDDHLAIYRENHLECPPQLSQMPAAFVEAARALSEREIEIAFFLEQTEPYPEKVGVPQFVDVTKSLLYLLGKDGKKMAFSQTVPTLSSTTHLWMRRDNGPDGKYWVLLPSIYLMSFVGWDPSFYRTTCANDLLQSLAGNAFSAFSIGAVFLSLMTHFPFPADHEDIGTLSDGDDDSDCCDGTQAAW